MKIIFLDVDGVLNNNYTKDRTPIGYIGIDYKMTKLFCHIVKTTSAKIVLSSTWRLDSDLVEYLKEKLGNVSEQIIGMTDDLYNIENDYGSRGDEINKWFEDNKEIKVTKFIVIDDSHEESLSQFGESFIQTSFSVGLTDEIVEKCINMLKD